MPSTRYNALRKVDYSKAITAVHASPSVILGTLFAEYFSGFAVYFSTQQSYNLAYIYSGSCSHLSAAAGQRGCKLRQLARIYSSTRIQTVPSHGCLLISKSASSFRSSNLPCLRRTHICKSEAHPCKSCERSRQYVHDLTTILGRIHCTCNTRKPACVIAYTYRWTQA
jgi:hypothetical protein